MNILITGCAGFIGFHLTKRLLKNKKFNITGVDNLNNYYDINLKKSRLKNIEFHKSYKRFKFYKLDISNSTKLSYLFKKKKFDYVVNLAAQAGVRYSLKNPKNYFKSNVLGFFNVLECCKNYNIKHLFSASSSSVYGTSLKFPIKENFETSRPEQFYAATKKTNEVMGYSYYKIYGLNISFLRFFTVYGPWGRPDMLLYKFVDRLFNNKVINIYNYGNHFRDFTYIDDAVELVSRLIEKTKKNNNKKTYEIYNVGRGKSESIKKFIDAIIIKTKLNPKFNYLPIQKGDIFKTYSNTKKIINKTGYKPKISINTGINKFINWYMSFKKNEK